MKTCKACNALKTLDNFRPRKDSTDGYRNVCKTCEKEKILIGKVIDEVKNIYGNWTVISRAENKPDGSARWNCICTCGTEKVVPANTLREGASLSCGCKIVEIGKLKREANSIEKTLYRGYRTGAVSRGLLFELTFKQVEALIYSNCHYCGDTPNDVKYYYNRKGVDKSHYIKTNGIDRIDNTKGYSISNCVPCCKMCNQMKSNIHLDDFLGKINKIYKQRIINGEQKKISNDKKDK